MNENSINYNKRKIDFNFKLFVITQWKLSKSLAGFLKFIKFILKKIFYNFFKYRKQLFVWKEKKLTSILANLEGNFWMIFIEFFSNTKIKIFQKVTDLYFYNFFKLFNMKYCVQLSENWDRTTHHNTKKNK